MSSEVEKRNAQRKNRTLNNSFWVKGGYFDYQTLFIIIVIVLFGIMMVYSSSSYRAVMSGESSSYFAKRQAVFAVLGIVAMLAVSHVNYRYYKKFSVILMYIAIALSGLVFIIGTASHGATRWIPIGPIHFQPSEVAKPILIIYMAHACVSKSSLLNSIKGIIQMVILPGICVVLIGKENLSTAIVCFAIIIIIMFVASPKIVNLVILGLVGVAVAAIAIFAVGYRGDRIDAWLHPETSKNGFQTMQSLYAIGSGGLFGRGLGESIQKMGFLPESHNDMIFSVICEELGLFGAIAVIVLFVLLLLRFRYIANNAPDSFGGLLCTGVITHIAIQFIINVGVVTNTIPNTGVTLPFISYGGTSLVFLLVEVGIVLGVSRQMRPVE
ncbi:MAG: putative lipid II flippase FtsW [Clostridium sp.]|nr:putative lipid II flippase FtsW [Clostridium sp.]MCM1208151.1 putative lipid II flippase FtsW [Ruminococcus sp.]